MQKVDSKIPPYCFDSLTYKKYEEYKSISILRDFNEKLENSITYLRSRLNELEELKVFLESGQQVYLFKNNNSDYGYVDREGNNLQYTEIHGKPLLIDEDFNMYEIIEYVITEDLGQDTGTNYHITSYVDKVVKVKKIGGSNDNYDE